MKPKLPHFGHPPTVVNTAKVNCPLSKINSVTEQKKLFKHFSAGYLHFVDLLSVNKRIVFQAFRGIQEGLCGRKDLANYLNPLSVTSLLGWGEIALSNFRPVHA